MTVTKNKIDNIVKKFNTTYIYLQIIFSILITPILGCILGMILISILTTIKNDIYYVTYDDFGAKCNGKYDDFILKYPNANL